jgi:hypothetical protein
VIDNNAYGLGRTHDAVLASVVAIAPPGPVLELGIGYGSTVLLHAMCSAMNRDLLSVDNNQNWVDRFKSLETNLHSLTYVDSWDTIPIEHMPAGWWSVALVDHAPAERRAVDIERLRQKVRFLIVHDSEHPLYNYEPAFEKFKYRYDYKRLTPWTTVLSDFAPFEFEL